MDAHEHVHIRRHPLRGEVKFENFLGFFLPGSTAPLGGSLSGAIENHAQKTHVHQHAVGFACNPREGVRVSP